MSIVEDVLNLIADQEQFEVRKSICDTCEKNTMNVCLECGCFIPTKAYYKLSVCPINKWGSIPINQQ
jgi:membrane protease subunit (stomatin/prohibitin family)